MIKFRDRNASYATSSIGQATGSMYHTGGAKKLTRVPFRPWEIAPLWIENVAREEATRKKWENMYGWLADYDAKVIIFTTEKNETDLIETRYLFIEGKFQAKTTVT